MSHQSAVLVVVLCGISLRPSLAGQKIARIQGGMEAKHVDFPWVASIRFEGEHFCGGAIINPKTVLTAAHCVLGLEPQEIDVRVGSKHRSSGGQLLAVEAITCHGQFDEKTNDYDIALFRLFVPIIFSSTVYAVPLAKTNSKPRVGDYGYVVGWGYMGESESKQPEALQFLLVQIFSDASCEALLHLVLSERMVCAGDTDTERITCSGDSGGPLTIDDVLVGIASHGPDCGTPDVYSKISALRPWIEEELKKFHEVIE